MGIGTALKGLLPLAAAEEADEVYDRGDTIEVVVPSQAVERDAMIISGRSLAINGRLIQLPAPVEGMPTRIEQHGELALLTLKKVPVFQEVGGRQRKSASFGGHAAGLN